MVAIFTGQGNGVERGSGSTLGAAGMIGSGAQGRAGEQVMLNAANGNLVVAQRDTFVVGRGEDVSVGRTYNNQGFHQDTGGDNWWLTNERYIRPLNTVDPLVPGVTLFGDDGSAIAYHAELQGTAISFVATDGGGSYDRIALVDGVWTRTDGDTRVREEYGFALGTRLYLTKKTDTSGNSVSYTYHPFGQIDRITTADGGWVQYSYVGDPILDITLSRDVASVTTGYTDAAGIDHQTQTVRYGYDEYRYLTSVTTDLSPEDGSIADGRVYVVSYGYTDDNLTSIAQSDGSSLTIGYDILRRVTSLVQTVGNGVTRTTQIAYEDGYTSVTDPLGQTTRLDYDADGQLTAITAPPATPGAAPQVTRFAYNTRGDVTRVTDPAGAATDFAFDASGNAVSQTDRTGALVTRSFDAANQLLTETRTGSDAASDAAAHTDRYVYDSANRLRFTVTAAGNVTERRYDIVGQAVFDLAYTDDRYATGDTQPDEATMAAWVAALADQTAVRQTAYAYDVRGNLIRRTGYGASTAPGQPSTPEGYAEIAFAYDQKGQLLTRTQAGRNSEQFVYDGLGRMVASTDLNGGVTNIVFDDPATRTVVTLANGLIQTSTYDKAGGLLRASDTVAPPPGTQPIALATAIYSYDAAGQLRHATDVAGVQTAYLYDAAGRVTAEVVGREVTEYRYDANDRVVATIAYATPLDIVHLGTLAAFDQPTTVDAIRPPASAADLYTWQVYDAEGRVVQVIDGYGETTRYAYDASGRLVRTTAHATRLDANQVAAFRVTPPTAQTLPPGNPADDRVSRVFYDADGRELGRLDGEGYLSAARYDASGQRVTMLAYAAPVAQSERAAGSLTTLQASAAAGGDKRLERFVYDKQGLLRFAIDAAGAVTEYGYTSAVPGAATGLVRRTTVYAVTVPVLGGYTLDGIRTALATVGAPAHPDNRTSWSVYDAADRLAYAIGADGAVTGFVYDVMGQVTRSTRYAAARPTTALPTQAEMDAWRAASADPAHDRTTRNFYNARGDLDAAIDPEGYVTRYGYRQTGELTLSVRYRTPIVATDQTQFTDIAPLFLTDGTTTIYTYGTTGRLTGRTIDGEQERYTYNANGTLATTIRMNAAGFPTETIAYTYDAAGRVTTETRAASSAQAATTSFAYDAFGAVVAQTDALGRTTTRSYDDRGLMLTETDALGGIVRRGYDAFGQQVQLTDARGHASFDYYDNGGRLVASRDAEDYVTEFGYNAFAEVVATTRRAVRATNMAGVATPPAVVADAADAVTTIAYDRLGRAVATTDAEGFTEHTVFDAFGDAVRVVNRSGGITDYAYTRRGLVASEYVHGDVYDGTGTKTGTGYFAHVYTYDARGNVAVDIEAHGLPEQRTTRFTYDLRNNLVARTGDVVAVGLPGQVQNVAPTETYRYDQHHNMTASTDANGAQTRYFYDRLDRLVARLDPVGTIAEAKAALTTYTYDAADNMIASRRYDTAVAIPGAVMATPPAAPAGGYRETLYAYDGLNRLTTTTIAGVRTGRWDGSAYTTAVGTVATTLAYDAAGNVVASTDGNGATSYSYYDRAGRKTAQVDAERYLTAWTLDAEGNVVEERRHALQATAAAAGTPPAVATDAGDRVTSFTYDRNGRRTRETRHAVHAAWVDPHTGVLTEGSAAATVSYLYTALGQVARRTEATGDAVDYSYDTTGRLVHEARTGFAALNQSTPAARPAVDYAYDGLGDLVRTIENGTRITRYAYATGGRLAASTDAAGAGRQYYYDAAGRKIGESYVRTDSAGVVRHEGLEYRYDAAGQLTYQGHATVDPIGWHATGDTTGVHYDVHGQAVARSVNGVVQERFAFDNAGRVWRSTADDGAWRYYVYDGAGNRTLAIESIGADIANRSIDQVLAIASDDGSDPIGDGGQDAVVATFTTFDARGLETGTILPARQRYALGPLEDFTVSRSFNAFGEATGETDALGYTTHFAYNALGRRTAAVHAMVSATDEQGQVSSVTPTELYYYDIGGRLVGTRDANGNLITRALLAGSGYGETDPLIVAEFHPDGGVMRNGFDIFGDMVRVTDETGRETAMEYDALGRIVRQTRADGSFDAYAYDQLGQRLRHDNGQAWQETTDYDAQGRIVRTTAFTGDTIFTTYVWDATISAAGIGTHGGWVETSAYANGRTRIEKADTFAHVVERKDLGDHVFTYGYDAAGRLTHMAGNGETTAWYYLDTGLVSGMSVGIGEYLNAAHDVLYSTYSYDARGSKTGETMRRSVSVAGTDANGNPTATSSFTAYQDAVASYDALGRIVAWAEVGNPTLANSLTPPASIAWEYDAAGNIRRELVTYTPVDAAGQFAPPQTLDQWYRYDAMNRVVVAKGALTAYGIVAGSAGTVITYDAAGRRQTVSRPIAYAPAGPASKYPKYDPTAAMPAPEPEPDPGTDPVVYDENAPPPAAPAQAQRRETYAYTAAGRLDTVTIEDIAPDGSLIGSAGSADFDYDLQGRVVRQLERDASGAVVYDRQVGYDARGLVVTETVHQLQGGQSVTAVTTTDYGQGAGYALGAPVLVTTTATRGGVSTTSQTAFSYEYFDGPQQAVITYTPDTQQPTAYTTTLSYTGAGVLRSARIADGRPRTVAYLTDALGRAIRRGETVDAGGAAPVEIFYRFDDRELGRVGNNGSFDLDYAASIADRGANPGTGAFRNGAATGTPVAEFGSFEPVNSYGQGAGGGSYTVRTGDTLASIARAAFGDANLWYLIAAANGLNADAPLVEGQILAIPAGVTRTANTASTFRPYDPARIIGDVLPNDVAPSPTTPQPQAARRRNRCGIFGAILLTVVAVAVTALTSGAATTFAAGALGLGQGSLGAAVVGGALAGAAGSVASQVVGVATGIQEGFSFRGVALAALAGGIGGGVGKVLGNGAIGGSQFVGDAVRGLAGSALTQGVAVVTGLQSKFDFAGVAAAALGAGAGGVAGRALGRTGAGSLATRAAASTASGIANAAARSLIEGTSFGRNLLAALPSVIGQTVGEIIASEIAGTGRRPVAGRPRTVIDPETGREVVVDDALAEQIDRRREGRRIDEEIAAGIRNPDGSRVDGGVDDVSGPGTASDRSKRLPGEYYDPERRETFSRAINNAWRESFEAASAVQIATNKRDFNDAVELRRAFDARDAYLAKLDDYATQMVDRPIGLFFGGIVATALGGAVIAPLAAAAGGTSTVGGLLTYGAGGAATNIVANSQFRLAAGGTVTAGTIADDGAFGFAGGIAGPIVGKAVSIVGKAVSGRIFGSAAERATVTLYRVDDVAFAPRIAADGSIPVVTTRAGGERALFVNIGQPERAAEFALVNRGGNATVTAVEVDVSFVDRLRITSVLDTGPAARLNPSAPLRVDINRAPDQFGLRTPDQIQMLRDAIRPGTARVVDPRTLRR